MCCFIDFLFDVHNLIDHADGLEDIVDAVINPSGADGKLVKVERATIGM